jgi:c-di-GMP-binding flagellar brake protein YcgR
MYPRKRIEKRRFQRLGVNLSALYEIEGPQHVKDILSERDEFEGIIVNLSEGGLAMVVGHYLPPGTKLHIKFIVYEYDALGIVNFYTPLKICGFVRHVTSDIDDEFRLGISFCGINEDKQDTLEDFLYLSLCPSGYPSDF